MALYILQIMAAYAFQRRLQNTGITFSSLHPGAVSFHQTDMLCSTGLNCPLIPYKVNTNIVQGFGDIKLLRFLLGSVMWGTLVSTLVYQSLWSLITYFFILAVRSPKDGAATTINCAVNPELNTQQCIYYDSCRPATSSAASRCVLQIHTFVIAEHVTLIMCWSSVCI